MIIYLAVEHWRFILKICNTTTPTGTEGKCKPHEIIISSIFVARSFFLRCSSHLKTIRIIQRKAGTWCRLDLLTLWFPVGIDVSKNTLDIYILYDSIKGCIKVRNTLNNRRLVANILRRLKLRTAVRKMFMWLISSLQNAPSIFREPLALQIPLLAQSGQANWAKGQPWARCGNWSVARPGHLNLALALQCNIWTAWLMC